MSILKNIQNRYRRGSIVEQLIYINIAIFISVFLFNTLGFLTASNNNFLVDWFALPASFDGFISKPWTIFTYGFLHANFIHILFNLIVFYFIGNLFLEYFTPKQLLTFYLLGTLFGGIVFLISYNYFPAFSTEVSNSVLLGASAGISAILIGIATYIPNYQLKIRFIGFVKLWPIAVIWVILDLIQIPMGNAGGHLAHLGGSLFGFLYVSQASNTNINVWERIFSFFKRKEKPLKTVYRSERKMGKSKSEHQQEIDTILDKISKSGYDTLTKEEKDFLFKQGKK